ncbi:hypothetical protein SAMN02746095_03201 [Acidocella aminolytica 101 = DSM 11237]|uniref:Uncharacterized protein n=1 Tax=Acidocella aminolytica 101 = DSM 11237 TaxID=1120923 RepID=A0A0D6PK81_9PROT|nr:hypothetical protein Aam_121_001 [Acidocella aminolytica 101 = DSM 11237]GBQ44126.1 hypothetical protein AA11237_3461 [Acidocella aminolytica 101 = DSM 11237]SHF42146.1 hypothetical protein SAMN02746095_03201 [Acidocella aminolytica 101 = DSM 11237]
MSHAAVASNGEPLESVVPGKASFDYPSVPPKLLRTVSASTGYEWPDTAAVASIVAATVVICFISMQLGRAAALSSDSGNGVGQFLDRHAVMDVGSVTGNNGSTIS